MGQHSLVQLLPHEDVTQQVKQLDCSRAPGHAPVVSLADLVKMTRPQEGRQQQIARLCPEEVLCKAGQADGPAACKRKHSGSVLADPGILAAVAEELDGRGFCESNGLAGKNTILSWLNLLKLTCKAAASLPPDMRGT